MRSASIFTRLLAVDEVVVEDVAFDQDSRGPLLVIDVRPYARAAGRCSRCHAACPGYDQGGGLRRWRHTDMGQTRCYLQARAPRVRCAEHGVVVAAVPWARPGAKHTHAFEDTCAWLAAHTAFTVLTGLLRVAWRTVADIVARVVTDRTDGVDRLAGLRRIGIDEIAYRKGHRYLTVIVDHDTGRLVWAREGRDTATINAFFDDLGPQRSAQLTHVSADGAVWIHTAVAARAPQAIRCLDPFHLAQWCLGAVDKVRRRTLARQQGLAPRAGRHVMWAVRKNPEHLSPDQRGTLAGLEESNRELYRAYLLKEQLRAVIHAEPGKVKALLAGWLHWARGAGVPEMARLADTVEHYRPLIINAVTEKTTNARVEATNTHLRALTKRAYGFHSPEALIAMATLTRGGACPPLPGRN